MENEFYNPYYFTNDDIIVWRHIVCKYGSVKHLINEGDELSKANSVAVENYNLINK